VEVDSEFPAERIENVVNAGLLDPHLNEHGLIGLVVLVPQHLRRLDGGDRPVRQRDVRSEPPIRFAMPAWFGGRLPVVALRGIAADRLVAFVFELPRIDETKMAAEFRCLVEKVGTGLVVHVVAARRVGQDDPLLQHPIVTAANVTGSAAEPLPLLHEPLCISPSAGVPT
jgi:hypothetical protein